MLVCLYCFDGIIGVGEGIIIGGLVYGVELFEGMKLVIDIYFVLLLLGVDVSLILVIMVCLNKVI